MRSKVLSSTFLLLSLFATAAKATSFTSGPITFGNTNPFIASSAYNDDGGVLGGYVTVDLPAIDVSAGSTPNNVHQTVTFNISLTSGYKITGVSIFAGDVAYYPALDQNQDPLPFNQVGYKAGQKLTLCDLYGCTSGQVTGSYGGYPLSTVTFTGSTAYLSGTYELIANVVNGEYVTDSVNPYVRIDYAPYTPSATPEPASLMLTGTGLTGLIGMLRARRKNR